MNNDKLYNNIVKRISESLQKILVDDYSYDYKTREVSDVIQLNNKILGRDNGYKCVDITATTNKEFRKLGVKYVHHIIEEDIMNYEKYFWTVCSGSLEKYMKNMEE